MNVNHILIHSNQTKPLNLMEATALRMCTSANVAATVWPPVHSSTVLQIYNAAPDIQRAAAPDEPGK